MNSVENDNENFLSCEHTFLTPLLVLAMFIPGTGLKLVGSYMQVAVWLALWQPLLSIVNYIVLLYSRAQSTAVLGGSTGFTMQNLPVVSEVTSRIMLAGSFMATLVPLFAWGMVKGGMAVTDLITRGLSNQIMSQAGNVAATGNVTLGNESMDDNTIDQNMLMPKYSVGYGMVNAGIDGNSMLYTSQYGDNPDGAADIAGNKVGNTIAWSNSVQGQKTIAQEKQSGVTAQSSASRALDKVNAMKVSDSTYGGTTGKSGTDTGAGQNASSKQQESQEVQTAWNNTMNWADSHTHATTGEMVQKFGAELKALGIGVGVGGSLKESAAYTRALTGAALLDAVSRLGAGSGLDSGRKADLMNKGSQMVDEGTKEMSSQDTTLSNSAKQARSFARTASSAYKESQQLSSVVAENRNTSVYVPLNGKSLRQAVGNSNAASTGSQNSEITPVTQKLQALQNAAVPASQALKGIHLTPKETQSLISTSSPQFGRGVQVSTAGAASVHGIPLDSGQVAYVANSKIVNQSIATNTDTYNKLHGQVLRPAIN